MRHRLLFLTLTMPLVLSSNGCQQRETAGQLLEQLSQIRRNTPVPAPATVSVQDFTPYAYHLDDADTPFGRTGLATAMRAEQRPAQRGEKQYLESFPLESIRMVGTLARAGHLQALLQIDKMVYQSRPGDYVGKNFGMIRRIAENEIELEELIPAGDAGWEKRLTTLALQGIDK